MISWSEKQVPEALDGLVEFLKSPVYEGHRRVVDWFVPCYLGKKNADGLVDEYMTIWNRIVEQLPKPETVSHIEFSKS